MFYGTVHVSDLAYEHGRAEKLHQQALAVSIKAFGEKNVQTSKHYGNLGRLYQSMSALKKAEDMHLKVSGISQINSDII